MSGWLASADPSIMAGCAIAAIYADVVKGCISKTRNVMAHGTIRSGRQVIYVLARTDDLVMAGFTVTCDAGMIKAACAKGTRGVTNTAVLNSRHVVGRFAARIDAVAGRAIVHDDRMIDECSGKTVCVVAGSAIGCGHRVGGNRRRFSGCVNTIAVIVA